MSSDSDINALSDGMEKLTPSKKRFKKGDKEQHSSSSPSSSNEDDDDASYLSSDDESYDFDNDYDNDYALSSSSEEEEDDEDDEDASSSEEEEDDDDEYDAYDDEKLEANEVEDEEDIMMTNDDENNTNSSFLGKDEEVDAGILEDSKTIVNHLINEGQFLVPTSTMTEVVDIDKCPQIGDSKKSNLVYTVVAVGDDNKLKILKVAGATTNGEVRSDHLDKQYAKYPGKKYYLVLFNQDHMQQETNKYVVKSILDICNRYNKLDKTKLEEMSIADGLRLQEKGLPFPLHVLLYYIDKRKAYKLRGLLKRLTLHIVESGYEEVSTKELDGLVFAKGAREAFTHEFLRGKYLLKMVEMNMKSAVGRLTGFLKKLENKYGKRYVEYLSTTGIIVKALSSWPPDLDIYGFTPAILDAIFGKDNWKDVFLRPPVVRGNGDLYDASQYTKKDFRDAEANLDEFMKESRNSGEFNFLDDNKLLFSDMGTTAEEYLIGKKFVFVDNVDGVLYYAAKEDDWDFPAMIGLHSPPCPIGNSDPDVKVNQTWVNTSRDTAKKIGSVQLLCAYLQTSNANPSTHFSDDMQHHRVLGNVLVMQCILEYLVVHLHYYRMGANVIGKDIMADFNVIREEYTKLILKFPFAISRYMTRRLSKESSFSIDRHFRETLRCIATANMNEEEIIARAVKALIFRGDNKRRQLSDQKELLKGSARGIGLCNSIHEGIKIEMVGKHREWAKKNAKEQKNAIIASEGILLNKFAEDDWSD